MTTPSSEPGTRRWRSRAFVQPLLVTIVGVAGPPAILIAVMFVSAASREPCPSCEVGYGIGLAIIYGVVFSAAWGAAMLAAGFIVGRAGRRANS